MFKAQLSIAKSKYPSFFISKEDICAKGYLETLIRFLPITYLRCLLSNLSLIEDSLYFGVGLVNMLIILVLCSISLLRAKPDKVYWKTIDVYKH